MCSCRWPPTIGRSDMYLGQVAQKATETVVSINFLIPCLPLQLLAGDPAIPTGPSARGPHARGVLANHPHPSLPLEKHLLKLLCDPLLLVGLGQAEGAQGAPVLRLCPPRSPLLPSCLLWVNRFLMIHQSGRCKYSSR